MAKFAEEYPNADFVQQVVAQLPWGNNVVLLDKIADNEKRKGILNTVLKIVGREMFLFTRLKAVFMKGKLLQKKFQTLKTDFRLHKMNLQFKL